MKPERFDTRILPATASGWDEAGGDYGNIIFTDVIFTEDFGAFKKGEEYLSIAVLFSDLMIEAYIDNDKSIKTSFKLIPN